MISRLREHIGHCLGLFMKNVRLGQRTTRSRFLTFGLAAALVVSAVLPGSGFSDSASTLYKEGVAAEAGQRYEAAYEFFKAAYDKEPQNLHYRASYDRTRFFACMAKIQRGRLLRSQGDLNGALLEFQNAQAIDPSLDIAQQEINATHRLIESVAQEQQAPPPNQPEGQLGQMLQQAQGPVELAPITDQPITLKLTEDSKMIYETIGKLAGINVLFDPDYTSRRVRIELNNVSLQDALQITALESRTFWRPVTKNTIFVASDTSQKRKELEQNVIKTFYLSNVSKPTDLQDAVNALRSVLEVTRVQQIPSQNAIVMRGTPDQLALAEKLIGDIDKAKPEVVVDIAVMQVSRNKERNLGITPPPSASVQIVPSVNSTTTVTGTGSSSTTSTTTNGTSTLTFNTFKNLGSNNYAVVVPAATAQFLYSDSDSRIIENPQIRAVDGDKATLRIGSRLPVATGSFGIPTVGTNTGGFTGTVNTQFQYIDVGVNIDLTPTIHPNGDVTLKTMVEISAQTGTSNIGGIDQPIIGTRKIEHEIRLREGEVNIMGGIFEDQEVRSWKGIPGLGQIPLFRYLFASEDKTKMENEVVFVMTPHIVRRQELTALNNKALDVGDGSGIQLRLSGKQPEAAKPAPPSNAPQSPPQQMVPQALPQPAQPAPNPQPSQPPNQAQLAPGPAVQRASTVGAAMSAQPSSQSASGVAGLDAHNGPTLRFDPPMVTQAAGSTMAMNVLMQSTAQVHSLSVQLQFDPNLLQLVNVANGTFLSQDGQAATLVHRDAGNGTVQISAVRPPGAPGIAGEGTVFTLIFALKTPGNANVAPVSLMAKDASGNPLIASVNGRGLVQIQPPPGK